MPTADIMELIYTLRGYPSETEWLEVKEGNSEPKRIAQDISALANAASYHGRDFAYKIWGVSDGTHELAGTAFRPLERKVGNQLLTMWLRTVLTPNALYEFLETDHDGMHLVVLQIHAAATQPVYYDKHAYIRVGSSTTLLQPGSAKERELWRRLQRADFCEQVAEADVRLQDISELIDVDAYYRLMGMRRPRSADAGILTLTEQNIVREQDNGRYAITNLGALLIARRLSHFGPLRKRVLRVVRFEGDGGFEIMGDWDFDMGYAQALREAEQRIMESVPAKEVVDGAFRRIEYAYPQRAVRELLGNAVLHQDLSDTTSGPLVGIHSGRMTFSNPGVPLIPHDRLLNAQPKSRNAELVEAMRRMDLCEEGGTGWDIAVAACEARHLPAPKLEASEALGTRVTIYADRPYARMTKAERREATYWHACLMYERDESMSNQSLRERFGLDSSSKNVVAMSRLIRECCDAGLIREEDAETSARYRRYIPAWG